MQTYLNRAIKDGGRGWLSGPVAVALSLLVVLGALLASTSPLRAQNMFAPVAKVNEGVITRYELNQRIAFLTLLRAPGDIGKMALDQLVQERLQAGVAKQMGITLSEEKLREGMAEFAARANLSPEQFIEAIAQGGVTPETFRDFVANGMIWREVVRARFGGRITVSEAEVDRAIAEATPEPGVRVLLAEIMLPADNAANKRASRERARKLAQIDNIEDFAIAARQYSISPTRRNGGAIDWKSLSSLPPALAAKLRNMAVGEVTAPIDTGERIALFQLRERREIPRASEANALITYAQYLLPGGRSAENLALAAKIDAQTDSCEDLRAFAKGQPEERLKIETRKVSEIPTDVALELIKLDEGEISTALSRNGGETLVVLMACKRSKVPTEAISREQVRLQLINQRLAALAATYLAELQADAFIEYYGR